MTTTNQQNANDAFDTGDGQHTAKSNHNLANDNDDDRDGIMAAIVARFAHCWHFNRKYCQRFRRRLHVTKRVKRVNRTDHPIDEKYTTTRFNPAFDDLAYPYTFADDENEVKDDMKNWQYHLTNQHF